MTWNVKKLKDDVRSLYGDRFVDFIDPSIRSLQWRTSFAQYHYQTALQEMQTALGERDSNDVISDLIIGMDDKASYNYRVAQRKALANFVACLQSMHAMADTLAHILYFSLAMELQHATKLKERDIYLAKVTKKLWSLADANNLSALVQELIDHPDFIYLSHLTNRGKHRAIVDAPYTVSCVDDVADGFKLAAFSIDGLTYPSRLLEEFISPEFRRQSVLQVHIGCELNSILANRLSSLPT